VKRPQQRCHFSQELMRTIVRQIVVNKIKAIGWGGVVAGVAAGHVARGTTCTLTLQQWRVGC